MAASRVKDYRLRTTVRIMQAPYLTVGFVYLQFTATVCADISHIYHYLCSQTVSTECGEGNQAFVFEGNQAFVGGHRQINRVSRL